MRVIPLFLCYVLLWAGRVLSLTLVVRDTSAPAPKTGTPAQWQAHMKAFQDEAQADWRTMMDSLHLDTLRPYVDGMDPHAAHVPNYEEALANPYPDLPDPLKLRNGYAVTTAAMWWKLKRPEIVSAFDREVYGITQSHVPAVHWVVVSKTSPDSIWQQRVLAKGWGYAELIPSSIQADGGFGLTRGIIGLVNQGRRRSPTDWGALKAWAWGVSRAIDYFETDKEVDAHQVGIEGHSRFGKAALVAMAYDPRIAIAYISSSGAGGAKLSSRNYGEIVENLDSSGEYHWMCGNFLKYAGPLHRNDLPVDAHELMALCAPRPVFISGGSKGDAWTDVKGMYMACVAASPVYALLGRTGCQQEMEPGLAKERELYLPCLEQALP